MNELISFKIFNNHDLASDLIQLLSDNDVHCKLIETAPSLDSNFVGGQFTSQFDVQILQNDFDKAHRILEEQAKRLINEIDKNHYLFSFSNEELFEIILKPDEWSELDVELAHQILSDRGENVGSDLISSLKKQRLNDLAKPEPSQKTWIMAGYLFSLLGGFLGIFIGWYIWKSKKTLPNGQRVFSYNDSDRKHGRIVFILGIIIFPITFILRLYSETW